MRGKNLIRGALAVTAVLAFAVLNSCGDGDANLTAPNANSYSRDDSDIYIHGIVYDAKTGDPLGGAELQLCWRPGTGSMTIWEGESNNNGYYKTSDLDGWVGERLHIDANHEGYFPRDFWYDPFEEPPDGWPLEQNFDMHATMPDR
jgi:hypothetical protein